MVKCSIRGKFDPLANCVDCSVTSVSLVACTVQ